MERQQEQHFVSNINSFDHEVPIYKVLFQDKVTTLLKYIVDKITFDRCRNLSLKLPSILLVGSVGKSLISKAFANSMCFNYEFIQGRHLCMGGCSGSLFQESSLETIYYVNQADKLTPYSVSYFHKFLTDGHIQYQNRIQNEDITVTSENKLFIFGTNDPKKICPDLFKSVGYRCYLRNYTSSEMEILVEQRLKWCQIDYQKQIPSFIVQNGGGSMAKCMDLLSMSHLVMQGNGRKELTAEDVRIGKALLSPITQSISAPPIDDIPF